MTVKTVVCFGDSNTYGTPGMPDPYFWGRYGPDERWPGVLRQTLGAGYPVIEEGLPGRTTVHDDPIEGVDKNGLKALPMVLQSHRPIDLLVLKLGTNDLKTRFSVNPEDIANSAGLLARSVLASEAGPDSRPPKLLVVIPAPILELETSFMVGLFRGGAEKSKHFARCYTAVMNKLRVPVLDAGAFITSSPIDGIHLEPDQHAILGREVAQVALKLLG